MTSKTLKNPLRSLMQEDLKTWVKTTRIQTAMVTALSLWAGHISVSEIDTSGILILGVIGVLVHIWGFTLNEVKDADYDKVQVGVDGHPIAKGKIDRDTANMVAWASAVIALMIAIFTFNSRVSVALLALSFCPGYLYDHYSKKHWWSGSYLSIWVLMMVLVGATYAGSPTFITALIAIAISIQIFVQVLEGDLKDIDGPERTFAEKFGVDLTELATRKSVREDCPDQCEQALVYDKRFKLTVYALKSIEALMLTSIVYVTASAYPHDLVVWLTAFFILLIIFMVSNEMWLVDVFDRDEIKKNSSVHELTSVVTIAASVAALDIVGALLIASAPIVWYVGVNALVHSGALIPDV